MTTLANYPGHAAATGLVALLVAAFAVAYYAAPWLRLHAGKWLLPPLQAIPAFLILYLLWDPSAVRSVEKDVPNTVLALFDTSQSMSVADMDGEPRLDYALKTFDQHLAAAPAAPQYATFGFDNTLYEASAAGGLRRWGGQSHLWPALDLVQKHAQAGTASAAGHVAGAVLFTDGQMNDKSVEALQRLASDSFQIVIVGVGAEDDGSDVALTRLDAPETVLINSTFTAYVSVSGRVGEGESVTVELAQHGQPVGMQEVSAADLAQGADLSFTVSAPTLGIHALEATVTAGDAEINRANNRREMAVEVVEEPRLRVLLYSQWAHPDMGKMRQALTRENKVSLDFTLDALVAGAAGLNVSKGASKFPTDFETLSAYDILVLGPCDPRRFTENQVDAIYRFVVERGGGILLLPGEEEFDLARSTDPRIKTLLPAALTWGDWVPNEAKTIMAITAEGERFPLPPAAVLAELPGGIAPYYKVTPKPAANVVATLLDQPAVVVQRVGRGHVCLINLRPLFLLYREDLYGGSLRTLLSGVVTYVGATVRDAAQIQLFAERSDRDPMQVQVTAVVQDDHFQPAPGATVLLDVENGVFRMDERAPGEYTATIPTNGETMILANVEAVRGGALIGAHKATLRMPAVRSEMDNVGLDRQYLQSLADRVGGVYYDAKDLNTAAAAVFPATSAYEEVADVRSAWRTWPWLLAICGLLTVGWFARRFMGMV